MSNKENDNKFNEELAQELESGLHTTLDESRSDDFTVKVRREEYIVKRRFYDKDKALETAESLRKDKRNLVEDNIDGGKLTNDNETDEKIDWDRLVDAGLEFDPPIAAAAERKPGDSPIGLTPIGEKTVVEEIPDIEKTLVVRHKPVFPEIKKPEVEAVQEKSEPDPETLKVEEEISMAFGDDPVAEKDDAVTDAVSQEKKSTNRLYVIFSVVLVLGALVFYVFQRSTSTDIQPPPKKSIETGQGIESSNLPANEPLQPGPKSAPFVVDKTGGKPLETPDSLKKPAPAVPDKSAPVVASPAPAPAAVPGVSKKTPDKPPVSAVVPLSETPVKSPDMTKPESKPVPTAKPAAAPIAEKKPAAGSSVPKAESVEIKDHFPYSVHVSSYKDPKRAEAAVAQLKKEGFSAYAGLVKIPGKGDWYRVYSGHFKTPEEAKAHSVAVKKVAKEDSQVQKTTWTIQIGKPLSSKDASNLVSSLTKKGYHVYSLPVSSGSDVVRVLAGAYSSQNEASLMVDHMVKDGFDAKAVNR